MSIDLELAPKTQAGRRGALLLRVAGIVDSERRGLWAYYYVVPDALRELSGWLG